MSLFELFLIAVGLSMDAFAVSVCKGLAFKEFTLRKASIVGVYFGVFQGVMPLIGYLLGVQFQDFITSIDHWIAFVLLGVIGINMIRESRQSCEEETNASLQVGIMLGLAVATSVDALAVGITFAFLNVEIVPAVSFIAMTTFLLSILGVKIGSIFGTKYKSVAELMGGIILILMGCKILLEHLGVLG